MLYVMSNCTVDIFICTGSAPKWHLSFIVIDTAHAHCASVADIFINSFNAEHMFKLTIRNEGSMDEKASVK